MQLRYGCKDIIQIRNIQSNEIDVFLMGIDPLQDAWYSGKI